jgi:DNA-binding NarL/FixJ family response regulator
MRLSQQFILVSAAARNTMRVFIVEDSPVFARAIADLVVEIERIDVIGFATDAVRAKDDIQRLNPDVVILDIRISGGSGLDVLKSVRQRSRLTPVAIMFSGNTEPGYRRECLKQGADFVFDKSQDYDRLVEVLRAITAAEEPIAGEERVSAPCPNRSPAKS